MRNDAQQMSNAKRKKKPRFGLGQSKDKANEQAAAVLSVVQAVPKTEPAMNGEALDFPAWMIRPPLAVCAQMLRATKPKHTMAEHIYPLGNSSAIQTKPRVREEIEIGAQFAQKAGVSYIQRFNELARVRKEATTPPYVKRDLLEEALDYLFQKYVP